MQLHSLPHGVHSLEDDDPVPEPVAALVVVEVEEAVPVVVREFVLVSVAAAKEGAI